MFRRLSLVVVTFLMLVGPSMMLVQTSSAKGSGLLSFVPTLYIEVDTSALSEEIQPDGPAVNIPVTVKYNVDVPPALVKRETIGRYIIFGTFIIPTLKIHLSVVNQPDWADISIANPDIYIRVEPNKDCIANTSLSISVYKDAPAQPYTLILRAEAPGIGRVQPISVDAQFKITPGYIPLVDINTDKPIKEAGPMTTITFPIKITSHANKETIVKLVDYDVPPGWGVQPSQNQIIIPEGGTSTLSVAVTTPAGFGWVPNQIQQIKLKFMVIPSPPSAGYEETSTNTYIYSISVRSGSAPAAGLIGGIVAILAAIVVVVLVMLKKKS